MFGVLLEEVVGGMVFLGIIVCVGDKVVDV